jgi:hypothetical protein
MRSYRVTVTLEVTASDPDDAARIAEDLLVEMPNGGWVMDVEDVDNPGEITTVDTSIGV